MDLVSACGAIVQHADHALLVVDAHGTIRWSNDRFADRFGCRERCAPGDAHALLRAPVLGMSLAEAVRAQGTLALDARGQPHTLRLLTESEGAWLLALLPVAVADPEPRVDTGARCAAASGPDAPARTCRVRVEELESELARAHADYGRLADTVSALVVRYDRERRRTYVNRIFEEFHGKTAATSVGRTPLAVPTCDAPHIADLDDKIEQVIARGKSFSIDRDYVDSRGRHICSTEKLVPEYDASGAISGALLVAFGRYEEHAAKEAQREAEITAREILDNISSAVVLSEAEASGGFRIVSVNRAFERMLDTPAFALVGKFSRDLRQDPFGEELDALRTACLACKSAQARTLGVRSGAGQRVIEARFFPSLERFPGRQRVIEIYRDVTSLRAAENKLRASNTKLQQLRLERELSIEDERKRIAHELHDELGQQLTALRYSVLNLGRLCGDGPSPVVESLALIDTLIDGALQSVRNVVRKLRPPALDVGLVPAVRGLIDQLFGSGEIDCDLTVTPRTLRLDDYHSLHTFRCIQEALTNVARHSCATLAYVDIRKTDGEIIVRVGDNGKGFEQASVREGNGLSGMHERARLLGGRLYIHSRVGTGTEVVLACREGSPGTGLGK